MSYWELKQFFGVFDLIVIGSGIVGINAALAFKNKHPKASVLIIERGVLPSGASTKNAGFACFGSPSEILSDLAKMPESTVWETVKMRWDGLKLLRKTIGDKNLSYNAWGGFELFDNKQRFDLCAGEIDRMNKNFKEAIGQKQVYSVVNEKIRTFGFKHIKGMIINRYEGQIDTAQMMDSFIKLAQKKNVRLLNNVNVDAISDMGNNVELRSSIGILKAKKVIVAINGFAKELLRIKDVNPARAQVLITKPIKNLKLKGAFHYDEGFYYFRNIDGRVLFGGGRNLDMKGETTSEIAVTSKIQKRLEHLLKTVILPDQKLEIEHRWAGIMGVGGEKKPIVKHYSDNVICAVRMGGMGVAIGSLVGKKAADLI